MELKYYYMQLASFHRFSSSNIAKANLQLNGFQQVFNLSQANFCIINSSCLTFDCLNRTFNGIYKAIEWKLKYVQYRKIAVLGGATHLNVKEKINDKFLNLIDFWCGMDDYKDLGDILLERKLPSKTTNWINEENLPQKNSRKDCMGYIQIQDGCDNYCSYCILPYLTGKPRSRSIDSIIAEVKNKYNLGYKHLVLTAQNICKYGIDKNLNLIQLIQALDNLDLDFSYMLIHLNICDLSKELVDAILNSKKCLNFFDLPIQHCNNELLKKMNRNITKQEIIEIVNYIKSWKKKTYIQTVVIPGFPGQTEEQFKELIDFLSHSKFDYIGIMPYSEYSEVKSYSFQNKIPLNILQERFKTLLTLFNKQI